MANKIYIAILAFILGHGIALQHAGPDCAFKAGQHMRNLFGLNQPSDEQSK